MRRGNLLPNIIAGVIVGVVALPLAMAFAIAQGVKPEQGLYTSIVAGLMGAMFGGIRLQNDGPTGAFIVILAGVVAGFGVAWLQSAKLKAGVNMGVLGVGGQGEVHKIITRT